MAAAAPRPPASPGPINFAALEKRFGLSRQDVYALALMEAIALRHQHRPRQVGPREWETDSYSEPGVIRHQYQSGNRLYCDCPAALGEPATAGAPRICSHTAAIHMLLHARAGKALPVRPMPPDVLRYDPSPEARAALALIECRRKGTAPAVPRTAAALRGAAPEPEEVRR